MVFPEFDHQCNDLKIEKFTQVDESSPNLIISSNKQEKVRACQSQISLNRSEARTLIDDCFNIECREISDLIEEELLLKKFVEDTTAREKTVIFLYFPHSWITINPFFLSHIDGILSLMLWRRLQREVPHGLKSRSNSSS